MSAPGEVVTQARPSKAWLVSCAALCLAIVAYGVLGAKETSGNIAYLLGYNLPIALLLAGALYVVFCRRESGRTSWLGFFFIYTALITASIIASNRQRTELRTAVTEIERAVAAAAPSGTASAPSGAPPLRTEPVAGGEAGKMEAAIKTMINRMLAQRREYELELNAIGWPSVLDGQRIRKDTTLAESKTMLRQARDIVAKHRNGTEALFVQIRRDIESSGFRPELQRSMLVGFDRNAAQSKAQTLELWSLEEQALFQFENVFTLLAAKRNAWQVQEEQILFNRQSDLDLFNSYLSRASQIDAKRQEIQETNLRRARESFKSMSQ